jgi:uncharacterized protein (DUF3084 family)
VVSFGGNFRVTIHWTYYYQNEKTRAESEKSGASGQKELLGEELQSKKEELNIVKKHLEELEKKSKSDIKVLVKEVKSLRSSQTELKKIANQYSEERTALQVSDIFCNYGSLKLDILSF